MAATEILQRFSIAHASRRCSQQAFQQPLGVGAGHGVHRVKGDWEVVGQQVADLIKVEQLLHQSDVIVDPIDHLNLQAADALLPGCVQVQGDVVVDPVAIQCLAAGIDGVGERLRCWSAVSAVHLHAEVAFRSAGVMAGREDDPGCGLALADQVRGRRCREDAAGGGGDPGYAMSCGHACKHADGAAVAVAAVAAHHQRAARDAGHGAQDGLDEALQVVGGLELAAALA